MVNALVRKNFFAIEGLDGVGKSTLIANLSNIGYQTLKTPAEIYKHIRKDIHDLDVSSLFYYLSSVAYAIEKDSDGLNDFFIDRYLFSSITQYLSKKDSDINDFERYFSAFKDFFSMPTVTFFITLDYDIRIERIKNRTNDEKLLDNISIKYDQFWSQCINSYSFSDKVIIDGRLSKEQIVDNVISHIQGIDKK